MTLSSIAALQQALEALEQLIGPENDPAIGWSGRNGTNEVFACEFCGQTHGDCTKIPHTARCFVTKFRAALSSLRAVVKDTELQALTKAEVMRVADLDECNPDDRGWGPKFSYLAFGAAIQRRFCEVNGLRLPPPPKENTQ